MRLYGPEGSSYRDPPLTGDSILSGASEELEGRSSDTALNPDPRPDLYPQRFALLVQ